ncbi:MAG TPA: stage II sporulation protein M [Burkholderiales bacterium]|nr:stage II sporulation protein M [Burkholderiales bacterium]
MRQAAFEAAHAAEWQAFERFLDGEKPPAFPPQEMPARYRRVCQALALATDRQYSPELVDRLNRLALRGHGVLYRNRRRESQQVLGFLLGGFAALVRREWRLVLAAALVFFAPFVALIAVLQVHPEFVHYLLEPEQIASFHAMYDPANPRLGMRPADTSLLMFGFYIWNNVRIGFQTFAGGLAAGVGSLWFLASNGVIIGAVAGYLTQVGFGRTFWSFVAGHSAPELLAIVLSGAAGLRLGMAIVSPGNASRRAALVAAAKPAVRLMYGAALMFCFAAVVEAFWSPDTTLPFEVKVIVGLALWAAFLLYFLLAGRARAAR